MADGWTTIGELAAGTAFEVMNGRRGFVVEPSEHGREPLISWADSGGYYEPSGIPARLLEPVAVAPGIDPNLRGLLLHALQTGETGALFDWLTEAGADPDLTRAVRENAARDAETVVTIYRKLAIDHDQDTAYRIDMENRATGAISAAHRARFGVPDAP